MKYLKTIIFILLPMVCFCQKTKTYTCNEINIGIIDTLLYKTVNDKILLKIHDYEGKAFKISNKYSNKLYYVSKPIMKKIRHSIKKNKCKNILIENIDNLNSTEIKIIRD